MRVVIISDTHNLHRDIELPEGDILVHCGDATGRGRPKEVIPFLQWFEDQEEFKYKIFVAGNHDFMFENDHNLARAELAGRNMIYLENEALEIEGIKFYGSPVQPWFHDWAFNQSRGPEIAATWRKIPDDTEFLITHGPPKNILDETREGDHPGCYDLLERIKEVRPAVHAFGHIHEGYGVAHLIPDVTSTIFINASICDRNYSPINKPIVVDRHAPGDWYVLP
jgi:Icc-related predicted phosphoesterase